ncbi:MAG: hypothetical protein GX993_06220 [Bacteroidales bacterium]|nr:hypothetical protein [Bacteroidales bacterium]
MIKMKLVFCILIVVLVMVSCTSHSLIDEINDIHISDLDDPILSWVEANRKEEGIYIGKIILENSEKYYLHINKQNTMSTTISDNTERDSFSIEITFHESSINPFLPTPNPFTLSVTKITTTRPVQYIVLNEERIETSTVEVID